MEYGLGFQRIGDLESEIADPAQLEKPGAGDVREPVHVAPFHQLDHFVKLVGTELESINGALRAEDLKKLGVVLKRAQYFLTCSGRSTAPLRLSLEGVRRNLTATERTSLPAGSLDQLSLFEPA